MTKKFRRSKINIEYRTPINARPPLVGMMKEGICKTSIFDICSAPTELVFLFLLQLQRFRSYGTPFLSSDFTDETDCGKNKNPCNPRNPMMFLCDNAISPFRPLAT